MNGAPYVLTFGETMALMRTEQVGPLAHTSTLSLGIGGSESNVAIGLQRLGVQTVWCGRVGADSLGSLVAREIRAEGVDVRAAVDRSAPTGLMIKERRTPATQRVSYYRCGSAGSRIAPEDIDEQLVSGATLLHVTGITPALSSRAEATLRYAVDLARAHHVTVSFDLNYRATLWSPEAAQRVYQDIIPLADVVFAGDDEAAIAVGAGHPEEAARRITALGPSQAVVKLGADGALALIDGTIFRQEAVPVDAVDTVGAGDAFVAGYLAELVAGREPQDRLITATITGAFACLVQGDWEGLPRRHELAMLQTREPVSR
ncbi:MULTISPECIES: sugar kinase [unclassified Arthrobacter]|jgi:2-dehydro-3-deoxygluconokinase|uniref:sugar kinase n=1 Tax=unclassified Arthrobacter TaxID=235627 RepID=UPI00036C216B|nr:MULTISPECIES: sugar kinase [unclassified Arthrobacter]BCW54448.1 ribokinase [Arthrobacter sp. StoSoilB19]